MLRVRFHANNLSIDVVPSFESEHVLVVQVPPCSFENGSACGGFVSVEVSNNAQDFSSDGVLFFYEQSPKIVSISPASIPETGDVSVTITGLNFFQTYPSVLTCRFGAMLVMGTYISAEEIACIAPPQPVGTVILEVTLNGEEYTTDG